MGSVAPKILLFGAGSIGAVHLHQFQRAGCIVTAICRSNYAAVKANGFKLISKRFGNVTYKPDHVVRSASECASETFDFIFVASKAFPGTKPSLADLLKPVLEGRKTTAVVLAQNGINIEEEIGRVYPDNPLISAVVYMPATQTQAGVIEYREMLNMLEIGTYPAHDVPQSHHDATARLAELIKRGGGDAKVFGDIQVQRWSKLIVNASWNPICALSLCTDAGFLVSSDPYAHDLVWGVMLEIVALANNIGIPGIDQSVAEWQFQRAKDRVKVKQGREMSMLQDVQQGRLFEVEAIVGNTVRLGRDRGIKMPLTEAVYALAKGRYDAMVRSLEKGKPSVAA